MTMDIMVVAGMPSTRITVSLAAIILTCYHHIVYCHDLRVALIRFVSLILTFLVTHPSEEVRAHLSGAATWNE